MREIAKKTIILYVLKMLYLGSSIDNPITITQMTNVLHSMNIDVNKRTISRNVKYLIDFGLPIIKVPGGFAYSKENDNFFKIKEK